MKLVTSWKLILVLLNVLILTRSQVLWAQKTATKSDSLILKIGIMQDQKGLINKFAPLGPYLKTKNINVQFIGFESYQSAADKFKNNKIHAMFSGSGVAGSFIIKGLAIPVVRPLRRDGGSHYYAVVIAPVGSKKFRGMPSYFSKKKIAFSTLASSGEFFYRALTRSSKYKAAHILKTASHGAAVKALAAKIVDIAIVKNLVWDDLKKDYSGIEQVGEDYEQNPDNVLIVSTNFKKQDTKKISDILISINSDHTKQAKAAKDTMEIFGFIKTSIRDFKYTIELLKLAGVNDEFDFSFKD
ncbi:MAG: PhnD/SsuA/transferrin family substrate-binding protein [Bacteriovoracaceae bacterium]|nr:PhnD/SsuA/transferrin family substrate-binding protein [Bacteriovoracaceae bacterium]